MNEHEFLLHHWGSKQYYENPNATRSTAALLDGYYQHKLGEDEREIKAINATQHNQLNIIDESEKV